MSILAKQKSYRVTFRTPNSSDPQQESVLAASSQFAAKRIFEAQYKGCRLCQMPQEIRPSGL
jgi:hypothetical protein